MGWFGGGSGNNNNNNNREEGSSASVETGFSDFGSGSASAFETSPNMYAAGGSGSGGASSGLQEFQDFSLQLQQQVLVQQVITELSHRSFEKCCASVTRDTGLTGKEVACISAVTNKWLDANEFLGGRLQRKQQQASAGQRNFN